MRSAVRPPAVVLAAALVLSVPGLPLPAPTATEIAPVVVRHGTTDGRATWSTHRSDADRRRRTTDARPGVLSIPAPRWAPPEVAEAAAMPDKADRDVLSAAPSPPPAPEVETAPEAHTPGTALVAELPPLKEPATTVAPPRLPVAVPAAPPPLPPSPAPGTRGLTLTWSDVGAVHATWEDVPAPVFAPPESIVVAEPAEQQPAP